MFGLKAPLYYLSGMSHEPKSPSLGMISTATRSTATVSPLTPSPISATVLANGNTASQSAHSGFAAALRKLAKQAEEPRGPNSISGESSPVSSPATNHSSPVGTPKRGPLVSGPGLGAPSAAHGVSSTPPVVTIAPTKTVNGMWRSDGRQAEAALRGSARERLSSDPPPPPPLTQEKTVSSLPPHIMGAPYPFGLNPSAVMQDPRLQALNLSRQMPHVLQSGAVPVGAMPLEEYLRSGFRPYGSAEDLRLSSLQLGLDPGYFRSGYLAYPALSSYRMDESLCLSALRSPYYQLPAGGAMPSLHPSTAHLHLPGVRYPAELSHQSLTALQSERLQMEDKLRQHEREREREKERAHEAEREKQRERERERERVREREEERERELERKKERAKEREVQAVRAMEKHVLSQELHLYSHTHSLRQQIEDRAKFTPNRAEKTKEATLLAPKPLQPGLYSSPGGSAPLSVPSLVPSPGERLGPGALLLQRQGEEERWLARQRRLRADTADRQGSVSECSHHSKEPETHEPHKDSQRPHSRHQDLNSRELPHHLGAPPPLISPKPTPPNPPTTLWNPVSLINSPSHTRRAYDPPFPPSRPTPGLTKPECPDRSLPSRAPGLEPCAFLTEQEKLSQSILNKQRLYYPLTAPFGEMRGTKRAGSPIRSFPQGPTREPALVYDHALQQHRTLLSKLDLEEKRRREAREKGYYYELDDSYDESDEEEVRAHLRRVTEQPPLKLDQSKEKLDFLAVFGLTTQSQRDQLLERKKKKRRKMMRERSPSSVPAQSKRQTPPTPTLSTRYTPEEMNRAPELDNKKHFLNMFNLNHVSQEQRIEREKVVNLLDAIKKNAVTLDTLRYATYTPCSSPPSTACEPTTPSTPCQSTGDPQPISRSPTPPGPHRHLHSVGQPDLHRPSQPSDLHRPSQPSDLHRPSQPSDLTRPKELPPLARLQDQSPLGEVPPIRRAQSLQNSSKPSLQQLKERPHGVNGQSDYSRARPWESLSAEEFAQHFHQSVLQSTHKSQHKAKGSFPGAPEANHKLNNVVRYNPPEHQGVLNKLPYSHTNGHFFHPPAHHESGLSDERSAEEDSTEEEEDEEEEEEEEYSPKWKGIEAILEAYQEYIAERDIESEVLQSECRRMEAQHYHLSVTADQLSVSMGELLAQRQRLALDRERMQAELEHFRKCLALPALLLHRAHYKGPPPR